MRRPIATLVAQAVRGALAWLALLVPRLVVPRNRRWVAVLGRADGHFSDNCKYFYIDAQADASWRVVFITSHDAVIDALQAASQPVLRYPGWRAAWFLLRCGGAVVDTTEWSRRWRRELLTGSRLVQLWHGVGFKRIEMDRWWHERSSDTAYWLRIWLYRLSGRLVRYDLVLATSRFYADQLFSKAFLSKRLLLANYPRNRFGLAESPASPLALHGVDPVALRQTLDWKAEGCRVVYVTPTFRDDGRHCLPMTSDERRALEAFCQECQIRLVFKLHPNDTSEIALSGQIAVVCAARSDVYPLLRHSDALVTDYSSIYMDYLMLDRPILFYVPDIAAYVAHRDLQFDFDAMTPGARAATWSELMESLVLELACDSHSDARRHLRTKAFDENEPSDATRRILRALAPKGAS